MVNATPELALPEQRSPDVAWHHASVTRARREEQNGHRSVILWFTGLSGAGKSTLAHATEERLHRLGCRTFVLDGDNVRHGLCSDLGFAPGERHENIRRIGHAAQLFLQAGVIPLAAFISPFRDDRNRVRALVAEGEFLEVHVKCSLAVCEARDTKGLYRRARDGHLHEFTGISSPYEEPLAPELVLDTAALSVGQCVDRVVEMLRHRDVVRT